MGKRALVFLMLLCMVLQWGLPSGVVPVEALQGEQQQLVGQQGEGPEEVLDQPLDDQPGEVLSDEVPGDPEEGTTPEPPGDEQPDEGADADPEEPGGAELSGEQGADEPGEPLDDQPGEVPSGEVTGDPEEGTTPESPGDEQPGEGADADPEEPGGAELPGEQGADEPGDPEIAFSISLPLGGIAQLDLAELFPAAMESSFSASAGHLSGPCWEHEPTEEGRELIHFAGIDSLEQPIEVWIELCVLPEGASEAGWFVPQSQPAAQPYNPDAPHLTHIVPRVNGMTGEEWVKEGQSAELLLVFDKKVWHQAGTLWFSYNGVERDDFVLHFLGGNGTDMLTFFYTVPNAATYAFDRGDQSGIKVIGWSDDLHIDDGIYWTSEGRRGPNNQAPLLYDPDGEYQDHPAKEYPLHPDNVPPQVVAVTTVSGDGTYGLSDALYFRVQFNEPVNLGGLSLRLRFNNGAVASSGGKHYEWPGYPTLPGSFDDWTVVYYKPQPDESVEQLLVTEIIPYNHYDSAGNLLDTTVLNDGYLADRQIRISVPEGEPMDRPYAIVHPAAHTDSWLRQLDQDVVPYFGHPYWPDDDVRIWYYWDTDGDAEAAASLWQQYWYEHETPPAEYGVYAVENGEPVALPSGVTFAGEYYLHYAAFLDDGGRGQDTAGKTNWVGGPYRLDQQPPEVVLPWDAAQALNTRYFVPITLSDAHSGLSSISYQWLQGGSAIGDPVAQEVVFERAWAMAPEDEGQYQLRVTAFDQAGNRREITSEVYTVAAGEGEAAAEFMLSARPSMGSGRLVDGLPVSPQSFYAPMKVDCRFEPVSLLGQCFTIWLPRDEEYPLPDDGRWVMFYDGLGLSGQGEVGIITGKEIAPPPDLPSGEYYFYVMAYDQQGNYGIAAYADEAGQPIVITIDSEAPTVVINPVAPYTFGLSSYLQADVVLTDNLPFTEEDLPWSPTAYLTTVPESSDTWYVDLIPNFPEPVDGVYSELRWLVDIPPDYESAWDQIVNIYVDRPEGPLQLIVMAEDAAECAVTKSSGPIYLDLIPPTVTINPAATVGFKQQLPVTLDLNEPGLWYSYIIDGGDWKWLWKATDSGGELGGWEQVEHYYISPDAEWSDWLRVDGNQLFIPLPEAPALTPGEHRLSIRFRDALGNEWRYPTSVTTSPDWQEGMPEPDDLWQTLDVLWAESKPFSYQPEYKPVAAPPARLSYSTLYHTNQSVTVTLEAYDNHGYPVEAEGGNQHTFDQNGSHTFRYQDSQGDLCEVVASVTWIDKVPPEAVVRYSDTSGRPTTNSILAEVRANEPVTFGEFGVPYGDGVADGVHLFSENGTYTFFVIDAAGNQTEVEAEATTIDRTPPEISVSYVPQSQRGDYGQVLLNGSEPFVVTNEPQHLRGPDSDNGRYFYSDRKTYYFAQNETHTLYAEDEAGNLSLVSVEVTDMRSGQPLVQPVFSPSAETTTNLPVSITLLANEQITMVDAEGVPLSAATVEHNGNHTLWYKDQWNNLFSTAVEVRHIDRQKPEIRVSGVHHPAIRLGTEFDPLAGVTAWDNRDGEITDRLEIRGQVYTEVPGEYLLTYDVTDNAGNSELVQRTVKVMGDSRLVVYVNGTPPNLVGEVEVSGRELQVDCFGARNNCLIRWVEGQQREGYFKHLQDSGWDAAGRRYGVHAGESLTLPLDRGGWYTVFVQDEEQQTVLLAVYLEYR